MISFHMRCLKPLLLSVAAIPFSLTHAQVDFPEDPQNFHVFLLLGQSNMEGRSSIDGPMDKEPHPRVFKMNSWGSWELAVDPITNNGSTAVGPGLTFAKKMVEENPDITIGLIPLAVGGKPISFFSKGSSTYQLALSSAAIARNNGVIKGILWHQGEHDSFDVDLAFAYRENLSKLIDDFRIDFQDPHMPFITGGLVDSPRINDVFKLFLIVWERIKHVAREYYQTGYARSSGAEYLVDEIHFSTAGQRTMGERYFEEYLRVSGYWTEKLKETLDAQSTVDENTGWKYNDKLGLYWDENYPMIKQAQLGWFTLEGLSADSYRLDSPLFGRLRLLSAEPGMGVYLYRENVDLEVLTPGDTFFVNTQAQEGDEDLIFDHANEEWLETIANTPDFDSIEDWYYTAENMFIATQNATAELEAAISGDLQISEITRILKKAELLRLYTIVYATESYRFTVENIEGDPRDFWEQQTLGIITRIDSIVVAAQSKYVEHFQKTFSN